MPTTNLTWQNLTNAIINGSGHLEKNAGADNCFTNASGTGDGGARSVETIASGDFEFRCTLGPIGGASGRSFVGLDNGSFSLDFATWQYCIHISTEANTSGTPHPANSLFIYRGSPPNLTYLDGVWTNSGQLLRLVCTSGVMRAYLDSLLVYTFANAPTYPIFACASLACLNKTVITPQFITGSGASGSNPCEAGTEFGETTCADPWTIPTPAAYPLPANGGPRPAIFQEIEGDWLEHGVTFADGSPDHNTILSTPIRQWLVEHDGLTEAEAAALDAHYHSTRGVLPFAVTHPYTAEALTGVRYKQGTYSNPGHQKVWSQNRSAVLIKYTS